MIALTFDEQERLAWITGDTATVALLAHAEESSGLAREESRERQREQLDVLRQARAMRDRIADLEAEAVRLRQRIAELRHVSTIAELITEPYTGIRHGRATGNATKPAPKWAQTLIDALRRFPKGTQ